MLKFGRFKKNPHFRDVQTIYEEEIGRLEVHRRIFYALSEFFYIGDVYPRSGSGDCSFLELLDSSFNLPENLVGCLNSGKGTPLFCAYKCSTSYIMKTINFSQVTPETVAQQKTLVDNLYASLMRRIHSDDFEVYRRKWAKARALLSEMQGALYLRKEVCNHG